MSFRKQVRYTSGRMNSLEKLTVARRMPSIIMHSGVVILPTSSIAEVSMLNPLFSSNSPTPNM